MGVENTVGKLAAVAVGVVGPPLIASAGTLVGSMGPLFAEDALGGWSSLIQTFGIAVACLVALSLGVWRALVWIGEKVVLPVANRHILFLDEVATAIRSHTQIMTAMEARIVAVKDKLEQMEKLVIHTRSVEIRPEGKSDAANPGGGR